MASIEQWSASELLEKAQGQSFIWSESVWERKWLHRVMAFGLAAFVLMTIDADDIGIAPVFSPLLIVLPIGLLAFMMMAILQRSNYRSDVQQRLMKNAHHIEQQQRWLKHCAKLFSERSDGNVPEIYQNAVTRSALGDFTHPNDGIYLLELIAWCGSLETDSDSSNTTHDTFNCLLDRRSP